MEFLLNIIYYVVPFIVLLGVLVFVHEFGHFIVARALGVKVTTFSIGFGKTLWSKTDKHGTNWKIAAIPLGGYCQFLGDADASSSTESDVIEKLSEEEKKVAFPTQNPWKKLAIVLAGPMFNYLFAILIFISIFYTLGRVVYPPVVGGVMEGGAAATAGLLPNDRIKSVNGVETTDFRSISNEVNLATDGVVNLAVERPLNVKMFAQEMEHCGEKRKMIGVTSLPNRNPETGEEIEVPAIVQSLFGEGPALKAGLLTGDVLESINDTKLNKFTDLRDYVAKNPDIEYAIKGYRPLFFVVELQDTEYEEIDGSKAKRKMLGIQSTSGIEFLQRNMSFLDAVKAGFYEAYDLTVTTLRSVGQMITGQRGGKEVGGIIRIAELSGDISKTGGLISFIYFMALLSVNLGLINLLPIPVLDGGHVVIFLGEIITRRELKAKIKDYIFKIGLLIILGIMVLATWNDVAHLISRWFD